MSLFISSGYCFALAVMILLLPPKWIMSAMIAALIHELCHYLAILACSGKTAGVGLYSFSARMALPEMSRGKEMLCALAGPMGGLLLLLLVRWLPRVAVCGALQSVYNLLPIYPLDGGRALRCGASLALSPQWSQLLCDGIEVICILTVFVLGICGAFVWKLGLLPLLPALMILVRIKAVKSSCKPGLLRVQ
jgi:stage IV sporulation protein FB